MLQRPNSGSLAWPLHSPTEGLSKCKATRLVALRCLVSQSNLTFFNDAFHGIGGLCWRNYIEEVAAYSCVIWLFAYNCGHALIAS